MRSLPQFTASQAAKQQSGSIAGSSRRIVVDTNAVPSFRYLLALVVALGRQHNAGRAWCGEHSCGVDVCRSRCSSMVDAVKP